MPVSSAGFKKPPFGQLLSLQFLHCTSGARKPRGRQSERSTASIRNDGKRTRTRCTTSTVLCAGLCMSQEGPESRPATVSCNVCCVTSAAFDCLAWLVSAEANLNLPWFPSDGVVPVGTLLGEDKSWSGCLQMLEADQLAAATGRLQRSAKVQWALPPGSAVYYYDTTGDRDNLVYQVCPEHLCAF